MKTTTNIRVLAIIGIIAAVMVAGQCLAGRDISTTIGVSSLIGPASGSADITSSALDVSNYGGAAIVMHVSPGCWDAGNKIDFILTQAATSTSGAFTAVAATDVVGATPNASGVIYSITASSSATQIGKVGYVGRAKYIKLMADFSGTATGAISATCIGGRMHVSP